MVRINLSVLTLTVNKLIRILRETQKLILTPETQTAKTMRPTTEEPVQPVMMIMAEQHFAAVSNLSVKSVSPNNETSGENDKSQNRGVIKITKERKQARASARKKYP